MAVLPPVLLSLPLLSRLNFNIIKPGINFVWGIHTSAYITRMKKQAVPHLCY